MEASPSSHNNPSLRISERITEKSFIQDKMSVFYIRSKDKVEIRSQGVQITELQKHLKSSCKHFMEEFINRLMTYR
jgi:hypothetical protein